MWRTHTLQSDRQWYMCAGFTSYVERIESYRRAHRFPGFGMCVCTRSTNETPSWRCFYGHDLDSTRRINCKSLLLECLGFIITVVYCCADSLNESEAVAGSLPETVDCVDLFHFRRCSVQHRGSVSDTRNDPPIRFTASSWARCCGVVFTRGINCRKVMRTLSC